MLIDGEARRGLGRRDLRQHQSRDRRRSSARSPTASAADMERAITAARHAFDETDWSTDQAFRKACLLQLKDALAKHKEDLRPQIVAEVGTPIGLTYAIQQDSCIDDMQWDIDLHRPLRVGVRARRARVLRHDVEPPRRARADRRRRRDHAVELPVHAQPVEDHARARGRLHRDPQARARHAVLGDVDRQARRRGDRHPAGRVQRRDVAATRPRRRHAHRRPARRHDLVHRLDRGRQAHRGARLGHAEAGVPRARRQVGEHRARRRRLRRRRCRARAWCACTPARAARSRPGCCCPRSRYDEGVEIVRKAAFESFPYGDPTDIAQHGRPADQRPPARARARLHREGQGRGRAVRSSAAGRATQFEKGYFVQPTLFVDVDPDSTIAQEEIFGPVLSVIPFEDDDDAVRIANNSRYGLSGAVNGGVARPRARRRPPDPHRHDLGQRRPVVRPRLAVRRLQGERPGPRARHRRLRGVPRDQDIGLPA